MVLAPEAHHSSLLLFLERPLAIVLFVRFCGNAMGQLLALDVDNDLCAAPVCHCACMHVLCVHPASEREREREEREREREERERREEREEREVQERAV